MVVTLMKCIQRGNRCEVPDDAVAGPAERRTAAGGEPLRPLGHAPRHRRERGGAVGDGGGAGSCRGGRGGVGDVCWWTRGGLGQRLHLHGGGGHLTGVELISEVGVGHPGGSVGGGRASWSRGRGSGWWAGLRWDWSRSRRWS